MLGLAWLNLRQVREALKAGRLEEAQRLLNLDEIRGRQGVNGLLTRLAQAYVERGERFLRLDDPEAAWRDLLAAEALQQGEQKAARLREALSRLGVAEVRALLQAGEPSRAEEAGGRLRGRGVRSPELQVLEEAGRGWLSARELAERGEFGHAVEAADRARRLVSPPVQVLETWREELERRRVLVADLLVRLYETADAGRWGEALDLAEQVLVAAPHHVDARKIRGKAWKAVEPITVAAASPVVDAGAASIPDVPSARFLLWIDGVGGYLVCLSPRVTLGQATPDARVDVPLVADVSRLHAMLTRDAEGYLLEGVRGVQVNGQSATRTLLRNGDRVTLGSSCQFQFRLPAAVSTSARLDLVSGHRLPLGIDAVLLMADTLVVGPGPQSHVDAPDLKQPLILFRNADGLGVRHSGNFSVNGRRYTDRALLRPPATVGGDDIAFAIEPVGARLGMDPG